MYRTNDISIKAQLAFALGTACVVAIVIAALAEYGMYATNLSLQSVYEQDLVALRILSRLENRTLETGALAASLAIDTDHGTVADDIHLLERDLDDFDLSWKEYTQNQLHTDAPMQALNAAFRTAFDQMREQGLRPIIASARANDFATANALAHRNLPALRANLRQTLLALKNAQVDNGKASYDASRARAAWLSTGLLAFAALGLAFAIVCAIWILLRLYRQLGGEPAYAVGIARKIADGDLTAEVTLRIGDTASLLAAMKKMRDALAHTVAHIRDSAHGVSAASRQIAGGNIDLSQRTEEQAASLEQTASSMEQLTATVKQNADSAQTAMTLAVAASDVTQRGGTVVAQTAQTMLDIHQESRKMVDIIAAIEGIAFQTNILALNAAVEAARAGESGRGFAVVASEVRLLAQRSATAAKEIRALIQSSVNKITNGTTLAGEAGNLMSEVQESAQRVVHIIHEIADASREQSSGIEQISLAVAQIDNITQQNAALVEEAAAATHALEQQAAQLTAAVDVFRIEAQREKDAHAPALPVGSARTGPRTATLHAANRARGVTLAKTGGSS